MSEEPGRAAIAIQEGVDPRQPMMSGSGRDQTARFGRDQRPVILHETLEELVEFPAGGRHVSSHTHFALAQFARLYFMSLSLSVLDLAEFSRQPQIKTLVQPAKELSRADIAGRHPWQPGFHLSLRVHVSQMLDLKARWAGSVEESLLIAASMSAGFVR